MSVAALRTGGLPKTLNWLGVAIGAAGVLSVVPVLKDLAYGFGLLQIVWFVWLGIVMLPWAASRKKAVTWAKLVPPEGFEPSTSRSGGARSNPLSYEGTEGLRL